MSRTTIWLQRRGQAGTAGASPVTGGRPRSRERNRLRPLILPLEDRRLLSTIYVTSAADNLPSTGAIGGTLRWAVALANSAATPSTIVFQLPAGQDRITLSDGTLLLTNTSASETISGPSTGLTINGGGGGSVFQVEPGASATISGLTIDGGNATLGAGGGVENLGKSLTLDDCTIGGNSAVYGGGIFNSGTVTLNDCTISGNTAAHRGGGIDNTAGGTAILNDCTIFGNLAVINGGSYAHDGGALFNGGTATLTSCTVTGNSAASGGSGLYTASGATTTLAQTIVSGNAGGAAGDVHGAGTLYYSPSNDLVGSPSPGLGALGNYGGPTDTIPLLPGSPAIGAGQGATGTDQRGLPLDSPNPDIGAFQSQGFMLTATSGLSQIALAGTAFDDQLSVTVKANNTVEPVAGGTVTFSAPASGASATFNPTGAVTIGSNGMASVSATANGTVGSYTVSATTAGAASAGLFSLTNQVTTTLLPSTDQSITYGTATVNLSGTIQAVSNVVTGSVSITLDGVTQSATIQSDGSFLSSFNTATLGVAHSPYPVSYSYAADGGLLGSSGKSKLTVTPAPLTITASNMSKVYGAALPALSATYSGFVNGETPASLTTPPKFTTDATASSPVVAGGYPITATGAVDGNYTITYATGTLTVTPASLTITADNVSKVYGGAAGLLGGL